MQTSLECMQHFPGLHNLKPLKIMQTLFAWVACLVVLVSYLHAPATSLSALAGEHDLSIKEYQGKTYLLFNHNNIFDEPADESWVADANFNDTLFALFLPHETHHRDHSFHLVEKKSQPILLSMPIQTHWTWQPLHLIEFTLEPHYEVETFSIHKILAQPPPNCSAVLLLTGASF